jgi:hypothetical protein
MRLLTSLLIGLLAAALLAACTPQPAPPDTQPTSAPAAPTAASGTEGAYPAPNSAYPGPAGAYPAPSSAYPGPEGAPDSGPTVSSEPVVVPEPSSADVGVAHGKIIRITDSGAREPLAGYNLYLGNILQNNEGNESLVELDRGTAPRAQLNALGEFVFVDVPAGRYGLMIDLVRGAALLNDPDDGSDLIVEIQGGQIVDLGEMAYPLPVE